MNFRVSIIIVVLTACFSIETSGQSFTVNKRFDHFQGLLDDTGWSIEVNNDGNYLVFGNGNIIWQQDSLWFSTSSILKNVLLTPQGSLINESLVWDTATANYPGIGNSSQQLSNGKYILGGGNFQQDLTQAPVIYIFDTQGILDTLYIFSIQGEEWIGRQARQTQMGDYVIIGDGWDGVTDNQGFVLKCDSNGNQLWKITYGGAGNDLLWTIDTTGTGFYVGGQDRTDPSNYQLWAMRLDSIGAVLWETIWGSPYNDGAANLVTLQNGNPLVASTMRYTSNLGPNRFYMAELDSSDGSIIWEKEYGPIAGGHGLAVAKEVEFSTGFIAVGGGSFNSHLQGVLLHTSAQGDSIWMRQYVYADSVWTEGNGVLLDVISTPDSGFIAVGVALGFSSNPNDPPIYSQDIWVVKVDSMGCLVPGCNIVTGIEAQNTNYKDAMRVWPNPVQSGGTLSGSFELPANFRLNNAKLSLVDGLGRLVLQEQFRGSTFKLQLPELGSGLYYLHLSDGKKWVSGSKVVVE